MDTKKDINGISWIMHKGEWVRLITNKEELNKFEHSILKERIKLAKRKYYNISRYQYLTTSGCFVDIFSMKQYNQN